MLARKGKGRNGQRRAARVQLAAGFTQCALDAGFEADGEAAIVLKLVLLAEYLRLRRVHQRDVGVQSRVQFVTHRPLLGAGRQQIDDHVEPALIVQQQMSAGQLNGVSRYLRRYKWIAVAIAADP